MTDLWTPAGYRSSRQMLREQPVKCIGCTVSLIPGAGQASGIFYLVGNCDITCVCRETESEGGFSGEDIL